ncbi:MULTISPECIES: L,D-transpeptidase [unclassified Mesorhizobium]|uniref:L,D-transpeptidase family protein n=1 Tax=unclassified Mesorhizobium TaxID=325217 RepID=UPI001CCC4D60|nr:MULTISPECIES: L,D-transpeptidase [unclassified Mesorhizobium]MBZ9737824.1 L,D-transpeptidase [Mesorhizobium sp. CO1-1-4]MBZ9801988.1 L,D-transpeptidase [Mesorhizobium sp. ES1-6]
MGRLILLALILFAFASGITEAAKLDGTAVNDAQFGDAATKGVDATVLKAQILLDRARFSPGLIDGHQAENFAKAVQAFQAANALPADGKLNRETWDKLVATSPGAVLVNYELTRKDVRGPFAKRIPASMERMARLRGLGYRNSLERIAEHFHISEQLLRKLNPGISFRTAGSKVLVPAIDRGDSPSTVVSVEIDKAARQVRVLDDSGKVVSVYPASIGSKEKPAPSGDAQVTRVVHNPTYHYDPRFAFKGVRTKRPFTIAAGPNNPVGSIWIDLSIESYGIHGTPEPGKIGKTFSHGCIRLTNWDAEDLALEVHKGTKVVFTGETAESAKGQPG